MAGDPNRRANVRPGADLRKLRDVHLHEYAIRFVLGVAVSVTAGILSNAVGTRFGGAFLAFPAILPAGLTLVQKKEGTRTADRNAIGAVLGGVALIAFAGVGEFALGHVESYLAVALQLLTWMVVAFALYALLCVLQPDACDRNQDED